MCLLFGGGTGTHNAGTRFPRGGNFDTFFLGQAMNGDEEERESFHQCPQDFIAVSMVAKLAAAADAT